jgi:glycosyltransferase involved in cell wall biosynthesis
MQEYFYKAFNKKSEHENLKVTLFSEFPLSYTGGGERLIRLIHEFLKDTGIDVRIIENTKKQRSNSIFKQNPSLNIIGLEFKRFGLIKFLYQDFPPLKVISSDENAVSLIFLRRVPPRIVLRQLEKSNSKVIFCLHGIALERIRITNPIIIAHQLVMRVKLRDLARYTRNHIFVQSLLPPLTTYLVRHGADSKNIFTIENQLESEVTFPERNDEEFQVTFIGRMEDLQKGIKRLKNVISLVKKSDASIKFNIIGTGKDGGMLNGLSGNANILNGIDDQRKNKIIASSNLALVTSNLEPYSLVVLEFLTSGVPLVTTPASGPTYILSKDRTFGKVVSFSAKSLAKSIVGCYQEWQRDKELYFSKRRDLYHKARNMFNSKDMLESYRNMIIQVGTMK